MADRNRRSEVGRTERPSRPSPRPPGGGRTEDRRRERADPALPGDAELWEALRTRDARADGRFCYGVRTTRIYCRPQCPSRRPKRPNVVFFRTAGEAERAGYRACRRCRPDAASFPVRHGEAVVRACRRIDGSEGPVFLSELAAEAGLSPFHFHRVFKEIVGITPGQYAAARRARLLVESLGKEKTVTRAIYDAGFGSSSRVYERGSALLGMTPSRYRKGAPGLRIRYAVGESSLGWVLAAATERGLCAIEFGEAPEALVAGLQERFPEADLAGDDPGFAAWIARVVALVDAPGRGLDLPLDIRGTAFQRKVWQALRSIPPGKTASYGEIAVRIGRPTAARAVARACAANGVAVAVPCHRAVRRDGRPGGYRWGVSRKCALLEREAESKGTSGAIHRSNLPTLDASDREGRAAPPPSDGTIRGGASRSRRETEG